MFFLKKDVKTGHNSYPLLPLCGPLKVDGSHIDNILCDGQTGSARGAGCVADMQGGAAKQVALVDKV